MNLIGSKRFSPSPRKKNYQKRSLSFIHIPKEKRDLFGPKNTLLELGSCQSRKNIGLKKASSFSRDNSFYKFKNIEFLEAEKRKCDMIIEEAEKKRSVLKSMIEKMSF